MPNYPEVRRQELRRLVARGKALIDFTYKDDPQGSSCPITSHMRRVNTRDGLATTGTEGSVLKQSPPNPQAWAAFTATRQRGCPTRTSTASSC